ncbi:MAG: carboxypeptidase-like regulatory domain-containing protein, partial [Chitinophagaceae bacterium]|nr:carboxypeptidase-like regulatory domain-containing protein [Chitinophagaceae bacterium]
MKLTAILLLTACLQVSAKGNAQKVNLDMKNVSLEKVFKEIKKQSGFFFLYNNNELRKVGKVSVQVNNVSVDEAIRQSLVSTGFTFRIVDKTIVLNPKEPEVLLNDEIPVPPPAIDIRGRVVNEKGEPVEGVTVTVKGTRIATATNANGEFVLSGVNKSAKLVFSGVNVETTEISVDNRTDLNVSLKTKISEMSEVAVVVNTGFQTISKER